MKGIIPNDDIDVKFLFYAAKANEHEILTTCMKNGTTVESINTASLQKFEVPIISQPEQREIVRILDTVLAREQRVKAAAKKILADIDLMKKSVLARAFRGELGTDDPSDVSALTELKEYFSRETEK